VNYKAFIVALATPVLIAGCASMQLPEENYEPGETIAAASERGVENNPEANKYLQSAKKKISEADDLKGEGEEDAARLKLMEAQADANYALVLLRRDDAQAESKQIREKVKNLEADMKEVEGSNQ